MFGKPWRIGTVAGIGIFVHWTFSLILGWILITGLASGLGGLALLLRMSFVLVLFGCVVLHELGHALAARVFGIPTRDITLLPIGGVARLERMPREPVQELVVALAGPLVNVVIVAVLLGVLLPLGMLQGPTLVAVDVAGYLANLMWVNVALVVFNMLPAFPMDGGRVLRAVLATFMGYATATRTAAAIGQFLAVGLGLLGLFVVFNPFLLVVAAFIFFGAAAESQSVRVQEELNSRTVQDGMMTHFQVVPSQASLRSVAMELLDSPQRDYPVMDQGQFLGMLHREDLLAGLARTDQVLHVADVMRINGPTVAPARALAEELIRAPQLSSTTVPVLDRGVLVGLLNFQHARELIAARSALEKQTPTPKAEPTLTLEPVQG